MELHTIVLLIRSILFVQSPGLTVELLEPLVSDLALELLHEASGLFNPILGSLLVQDESCVEVVSELQKWCLLEDGIDLVSDCIFESNALKEPVYFCLMEDGLGVDFVSLIHAEFRSNTTSLHFVLIVDRPQVLEDRASLSQILHAFGTTNTSFG